MKIKTLPAFTDIEFSEARKLLAAKVSTMLGRKMEEADWDFVYCNSKNIPTTIYPICETEEYATSFLISG